MIAHGRRSTLRAGVLTRRCAALRRRRRLVPAAAWAFALTALLIPSPSAAGDNNPPSISDFHDATKAYLLIGITAPQREAVLAVVQPGRLARLLVAEGESVAEGSLVFAIDDGGQAARVEMAKAAAESTWERELTRVRWERNQRELDRLINLYGAESASSKEVADARTAAEVSRLEHEQARFNHAQALLAYEREYRAWELLRAHAPFDGYVAERLKEVGETVNENEGVVRLAQLDPLEVALDCPLPLASRVRVGDRLPVRPMDAQWEPREGTVVLANRVADGASQTFKVKLTVPNRDGAWVSGLKVAAEIPPLREPRAEGDDQPRPATAALAGSDASRVPEPR
ncbi:MAG: efflux RND transporter periplasmic adaptor subunit [Planctomycetes bacterium]|nr:efflux RND transporter periplasmic adaptor subunit [Planctomycetota bacterium]